MDFEQFATRIEVADVEWYASVAHPEAALVRLGEEKKHSMVFRETITVHEAFLLLCRIKRELKLELASAN